MEPRHTETAYRAVGIGLFGTLVSIGTVQWVAENATVSLSVAKDFLWGAGMLLGSMVLERLSPWLRSLGLTNMKNNLVFAILAGMLAPCVALAVVSALTLLVRPEPNTSFVGAVLGGFLALVYTIPAVLLYGLPLFLLLRKLKMANLFTCLLSALAPIALAALYPPMTASVEKLLVFGSFFLVSALGFWFFARKTLP